MFLPAIRHFIQRAAGNVDSGDFMMKMSPMQKYAMRLLIAGGRCGVWAEWKPFCRKRFYRGALLRDASREVRILLPLLFRLRKNPILKFENLYAKKQKHPR